MLDIAIVASIGWTYNMELHSRNGHGHVAQNKVQLSFCHRASNTAMMVVRLLTTTRRGKPTTLDSGSYFMRCLLPPIQVEKICIGHFQTMLLVGILHHLVPHVHGCNERQFTLNLCKLKSQGGQPLHLVAYGRFCTQWIVTASCRWLL